MNNIESRWTVYGKKADFGLIGQKYGIDPVVARVIRNRDIVSEKDIEAYLKGNQNDTCFSDNVPFYHFS